MKLDEKLISLRKEKGLTQLEAAEKLGVSRQAISKWESGAALPSMENLLNISKLYCVSMDYLIDDNSNSEMPAKPVQTDQSAQLEGTGKSKKRKWVAVFLAVLILAVIVESAVIIGFVIKNNEKHKVWTFDEMYCEDWSNSEVDVFHMQWW